MFGKVQEVPQTEKTPFYPRSPYSCAPAHWMTINYRESYDMYACGILFNHESPRRETFVTRKITRPSVASSMDCRTRSISATSMPNATGDSPATTSKACAHAPEEPDDYVLPTGKMITVRRFAELAFAEVGLDPDDYIEIDPRYFRPAEVNELLGDCTKAKEKLGWEATTSLEELVKMMVEHDMELAAREKTLRDAGHELPASVGHDQ